MTYPVGAVGSETSVGAEASEVVGGLVQRREGERLHVAGVFDEVEDTIDSLEGVVEVGGIVEPAVVEESLADVEVVDATWQAVKTDDDVHAIGVDRVVGDGLEELLLITVVKLRARENCPSSVRCGYT